MPEGYDWKDITAFLMKNHGMEVAGGLGPTVGKVGRALPSCCPRLGMNPAFTATLWLPQRVWLAVSHCPEQRIAAQPHTQSPAN